MRAFTKGDYALETTSGTACVHVPHDISADSLAHAAAKLVAAKAEASQRPLKKGSVPPWRMRHRSWHRPVTPDAAVVGGSFVFSFAYICLSGKRFSLFKTITFCCRSQRPHRAYQRLKRGCPK